MLTIRVPFPVVPKARPRVGAEGTYMPSKYKECVKSIGYLFTIARQLNKNASFALHVTIDVDRTNAGDVDNILGTIMDAGNGIVWHDDRQVTEVSVVKRLVPKGSAGATIALVELPETGFEHK